MPYRRRRSRRPVAPMGAFEAEFSFGLGPSERSGCATNWNSTPQPQGATDREIVLAFRDRYLEIREELIAYWRKEATDARAKGHKYACPWGVAAFEAKGRNWKGACRRLGIVNVGAPSCLLPRETPAECDDTIPPETAQAILAGRAAPPRSKKNPTPSNKSGRRLRLLAGGVKTKSTNNPGRTPAV